MSYQSSPVGQHNTTPSRHHHTIGNVMAGNVMSRQLEYRAKYTCLLWKDTYKRYMSRLNTYIYVYELYFQKMQKKKSCHKYCQYWVINIITVIIHNTSLSLSCLFMFTHILSYIIVICHISHIIIIIITYTYAITYYYNNINILSMPCTEDILYYYMMFYKMSYAEDAIHIELLLYG